jgi:hypothetical protein
MLSIGMAQHKHKPNYDLQANRNDSIIYVDGVLSENIWHKTEKANDFYQNYPTDTVYAKTKTEVMVSYDDQNVYIAAICHDHIKDKKYVVSSLKRDFDGGSNDNFSVYIDPFRDGLNGFMFSVTPLGVEREGLLANGDNMQISWDNKWKSATKIYEHYWVVEMAIPLSTLRFKAESQHWKMNFARIDLKRNERSTWVPVGIAYPVANLAFTGNVYFPESFNKQGANISIIPYITTNATKNNIPDNLPNNKEIAYNNLNTKETTAKNPVFYKADYQANVGLDAKIAVTSSLNLDLTVNPDFSTVEADVQVTNLSRFEIFYTERRQFFIENSDLFSSFGFSRIRPFFSRRIGIAKDKNTGVIVQNPILYGARLSGKINKDWRMGLMNMQTASVDDAGIPSQNYTVAAVQRQVFARSNIAAIVVNRQRFDKEAGEDAYTRVVGIDYNLQSKDNRWRGKLFYHKGLSPNEPVDNQASAGWLGYNVKKFFMHMNYEYVGKNYKINDIGFVTRRAYWRIEPMVGFNFFPKQSKTINQQGLFLYQNAYWDLNGKLLDWNSFVQYSISFLNNSYLEIGASRDYTLLFNDFDPTNTDSKNKLQAGSSFVNHGTYIYYNSTPLRKLGYSASIGHNEYYNGKRTNFYGEIRYRFQPYGSISVNIDYNDLTFPEPYKSTSFALVGTRADVSLNRKLFLTGFLQYNQQGDNVNLNTRLQWRFKPVSDLFLVYTENYFPTSFAPKGRSLVLKLTYWFNV